MRSSTAFVLTALLLATACAAPQPEASPTRDPSLGEPAEVAPGDAASAPSAAGSEQAGPGATAGATPPSAGVQSPASASPEETGSEAPATAPQDGAEDPATTPEPGGGPTSEAPGPEGGPRSFRLVGSVEDATGDQGLEGPGYADIRRVTVEDDGPNARIRVLVAGRLPTPPADGEVIGVGVNLLRQDSGESAYQLFADGGSDGWLAYLQTPDGFVAYPGEFRVGGDAVEFVIPWGAIDSPSNGPVRAFVDWSRERPVLNAAAEDRAPDDGDGSFDRR